MAYERNPNDPFIASSDPYRSTPSDDQVRRQTPLDNELQVDPELAQGPASGGRIAVFAVGIAIVLGAVFYGLNSSSINQAGTASTAQNTTQTSPPAAPTGMRDVTPRTNTEPGMTTGAAPATTSATPANPVAPPAATPTGPDLNRSGNPPASK